MKVILLKDVRGVGMHGTVQQVADGFATNSLFPRGLAVPATEAKIKEIEAHLAAKDAQKQKEEEQLAAKIHSLHGKQVHIASRATDKGGLFKTITAGDVAKAIRAEHSLEIPEAVIHISNPIKTIGEHVVQLVGKTAKAELGVVVSAL